MDNFRKILAALDLGPQGDVVTPGGLKALRRALWIANRVKGSLTLFHSRAHDEYWDPETKAFIDGTRREGDRRRVLESAVDQLPSEGVDIRVVVREESAALALVREVLREGIDVVVAGKRAREHGDGRKLGSVSRKLLRDCPCPVWLEDPGATADPTVILAATDLTPVGDRVIELASSVAEAFGAKLHIVHAYPQSLEAQMEGGEARLEYERQTRKTAVDHIERVLSSTPMAGAAKLHVGLTSPSQAILEGLERLKPGLVVMGTVSRGGIAGLLMGNTAERMVDRIDCAVLTVKPKDFICPILLE